jgi:type IV secretory pathway TraG/TraD family ATPase VirD4
MGLMVKSLSAFDRWLGRRSGMAVTSPTAVKLMPYRLGLNDSLYPLGGGTHFTLGDAMEHILALGGTGSGKTSGPLTAILGAYLRAGFGGLVLTTKNDDCARVLALARAHGREKDVIVVNPRTMLRFNFLDHEFSREGRGAGLVDNAVALLMEVIENKSAGGKRQDTDSYWTEGARRLLRHSMETLRAAGMKVSMWGIKNIIDGMPSFSDRTDGPEFPPDSFLLHCLNRAEELGAETRHLRQYWLQETARKGASRQVSGFVSTFTGMADPFLHGVMADLFASEHENLYSPDWCRVGSILIIDLPVSEYGEVGRTAQLIIKKVFIDALLRRQGLEPGEVPCFLVCDEYQFLATASDAKLLQAGRSSYVGALCLTQNVNNLYAAMGDGGYHQAHATMSNFQTLVFCQNGDSATGQWAADTIGRVVVTRYNGSASSGVSESWSDNWGVSSGYSSSSQGGSHSRNRSSGSSYSISGNTGSSHGWGEQEAHQVMPVTFTQLASGGPRNNYRVQTIVFKPGKRFPPRGLPYMGVTFRQR